MSKKLVLSIAGFLFLLNFFVWQEIFALNSPKVLKVDFLDVGQGDSAFIE
jgi:beta-lactamase superfamily II metal-dependent hydrolase